MGNDFLLNVKIDAVIPFEYHSDLKYYYIRSVDNPYTPDLDIVSIVNQHDLYAKADIPISQNETVNMVLKVFKNGKKKYTMQYGDDATQLRIRTDSAHDFPHVDIENGSKPQEKIKLRSEPEDYEASINTILRYVEKKHNRSIGCMYWLMPAVLVGSGRTIPYMFDAYQKIYNLNTPFTDIARFVSIDFIKETKNKILDINNCNNIIHSEFRKCKEIEQKMEVFREKLMPTVSNIPMQSRCYLFH